MQEEITQGAVSLSVEAGKMTADLLQKALKKVLEEMQEKPSQRTLHQGKQTLHQLKQHGASLTNIEITEQNIKAFSAVAKMFPTPLASDKNTCRDAANLDVYLSDNGIFRKRNKDGSIWSLSLSAAVYYLTPAASEGYRSTLKPEAFRDKSPATNLSAQIIHQEKPLSEKAALNPDWVEWLMGFPQGWTAASSGPPSRRASPA